MKSFVIAVLIYAVFGVALSEDAVAEKKALIKSCREENKVSEQELEDLHSGTTQPENVSQGVKCTFKCVMEKTGVMDPSTGEFLADRFKEKLTDKEKGSEAVDRCKGQKGANPCETAMMITGCLFKNRVKLES